jgi:hypothetical protein
LKLRHYYGTSENAVRIQITVALIAFMLLRLAHRAQHGVESLTTFARLVSANVLHRKPLDQLAGRLAPPAKPPRNDARQGTLLWT